MSRQTKQDSSKVWRIYLLMADVKDNNYFTITVDAGEGINPETAPIVEAHRGITWAENNPDGATFIFTLPPVSNNKN